MNLPSTLAAVAAALFSLATAQEAPAAAAKPKGAYAEVNGLKLYYEVHGTGAPLVLLHGAFGTIEGWGSVLPALAKHRKVIAVELQGHGRTADIDRPLAYRQLAEDTAALLGQLQVGRADVFGYSMGGTVALALAIWHPELVRKVAVLGSCTRSLEECYDREVLEQFLGIIPEEFNYPEVKDPYVKVAPDPGKWPVLVAKVVAMGRGFEGFADELVKSIQAETLVMMGDRDCATAEHAVEIFRLVPRSRLAIFPGGDHFLLFTDPKPVLSVLVPFLDAPPAAAKSGG